MAKAPKWGVNTYVESTKPKIGRHKKRMNKHEKRNYKKIEDKADEKLLNAPSDQSTFSKNFKKELEET